MNFDAICRGRDRATSPVPVLAIAAIAAILIAVGSPDAAAQSLRGGGQHRGGVELWLEPTAMLEPVTSFDFQGRGHDGPERGPAAALASLSAGRSLVTGFSAPPTGTPVTVVRREIDGLWRLRVRNTSSLPYTRVDYDVIGANGEHGVFSHTSNERSMIAVRVVELPMRQLDQQPGGSGTLEGGVMLEMDLGQAVEAGHYAGSLRVTIIQL